jgi:hypothetical protein
MFGAVPPSAPPAGPPSPATPTPDARGAAGPSAIAPAGRGEDPAQGNILSRIGQALHDNSSMLMAFGGGTMTGGLGKGFQAAAGVKSDVAPPQAVKIRKRDGSEALLVWDATHGRFVPVQVPGLA